MPAPTTFETILLHVLQARHMGLYFEDNGKIKIYHFALKLEKT